MHDALLQRMERLRRQEQARAQVLAAAGGPETLVHGDLWPTNTIVVSQPEPARVCLIDWDEAAVGPAGFDLSTFLLRFDPSDRAWILEAYRSAVDRLAGWELGSEEELNSVFETAAYARLASLLVWSIATLERDAREPLLERLTELVGWIDGGRARAAFAMKALIVNGDDFGASHGINLGIVEAHRRGVLTSTSLMVDPPASVEAARLASEHPGLGVGLHVVMPESNGAPADAEIERQLQRFTELTGRAPTHIDSHHHVHHGDGLLPAFLAVGERHGLPLRGHCGVRHIGRFYGQWDGDTHLEAVGPDSFTHIVATEVGEGFDELCCHPGYVDDELVSSYTSERRAELDTLCHPAAAAALSERGIRLATFREVQHA